MALSGGRMPKQTSNRFSLHSALLAALPLIVVGLALWTLSPEGPRGAQANSTPEKLEAVSLEFPFTNDTGQQATDLHVTFSSPIEKATVTTQPEECDADPVGAPDIFYPGENMVAIVWSINCVDPLAGAGSTVTIKVFSKDPGVHPVSVRWTKNDVTIPTITQTVEVTTTPSPSPQCVALAQRDAGDAEGHPGHADQHARNADRHARHADQHARDANEHTGDADPHDAAHEHAGPADEHLHEHAGHAYASETLRRRQPGPEHHERGRHAGTAVRRGAH